MQLYIYGAITFSKTISEESLKTMKTTLDRRMKCCFLYMIVVITTRRAIVEVLALLIFTFIIMYYRSLTMWNYGNSSVYVDKQA